MCSMSDGGKFNEKIEVGKREKKNYARQWPLKLRPGANEGTSSGDTEGNPTVQAEGTEVQRTIRK